MRHKLLLLCLSFFLLQSAAAQSRWNMNLLSRWDNDSLPSTGFLTYNEVWGWYDPVKHKEYALLCSADSVYFFDVSNPTAIKLCDAEAGRSAQVRNRDIITYSHYAYSVADQGNASLQIFDLQYLPDSVHKVYDHDSLSLRSHTLCVDTLHARLYLCNNKTRSGSQTNTRAVAILSLLNPEAPALLGYIDPPIFDGVPLYNVVHNAFAHNNNLFCAAEAAGLYIYDMSDPTVPKLRKALPDYPEKGFCHSPAVNKSGELLAFTDENNGLGIKLYDISALNNFELQNILRSNSFSIAHRPYFLDTLLYISYYHDGVYAFDISNPANPKLAGFYDTYAQTSYSGLAGCWGVYPYLPSGIVLAADMENGLFVLKPDFSSGNREAGSSGRFQVYPNPFTDRFSLELPVNEPGQICIFNHLGQMLLEQNFSGEHKQISLSLNAEPGIYFYTIYTARATEKGKLLKTH